MSRQPARSAGRDTWQTFAYRFAIRISEPSPYGVNGFKTLLVEIEQVTPAFRSGSAGTTPRGTAWSWLRPIKWRSVEGNIVTATPALANCVAMGPKRSGGSNDI